ncbi:MAG: HAD family hydrolase [Sphingomonadales bacterium]
MIRAVLFDLDETLLDRTASVTAFLADQYARFAAELGGCTLARFQERFLALDARGSVRKSVVYPALLAEFGGIADTAALVADYYAGSWRHARPMPGMDETLAILRGRGLGLGIVSNGETHLQWSNIDGLGLRERMDAVLISQDEGLRKPDAALFQRAAGRLGLEPEDCVFVGDNPEADVLGALRVGMHAVWLWNGLAWPKGEVTVPTIRRLSELVDLPLLNP